MKRAVIFSNGNLSDCRKAKGMIRKDDYVICADGAAEKAITLGIIPNTIIGDFDSLSKETIKNLSKYKIAWVKYPVEKDKTDFELAVDLVLKKGFTEITVFGLLGDRIDHLIANIMHLWRIKTEKSALKIVIVEGKEKAYLTGKNIMIKGKRGDKVSIIPLQPLKKVQTSGFSYKLEQENLDFGVTRGVSNKLVRSCGEIDFKEGLAFVVHNQLKSKYV